MRYLNLNFEKLSILPQFFKQAVAAEPRHACRIGQ